MRQSNSNPRTHFAGNVIGVARVSDPKPVQPARHANGNVRTQPKLVQVTCWCERGWATVPREEMLAGLTGPCRRNACKRIDARKRRG